LKEMTSSAIAALIEKELPEAIWSESKLRSLRAEIQEGAGKMESPVTFPRPQVLLDGGSVGNALEEVTS
jgi:hypothetical protein